MNVAQNDNVEPSIVLSLCDGMGGMAMSLKSTGSDANFNRYISIEKSKVARKICQAANPPTETFPGVEHGIDGIHDISDITEEMIKGLPPDSIGLVSGAPMCNDHSKLRLLKDRPEYKGPPRKKKDPRPGLDGKCGMTFRQTIKDRLVPMV